MAVRNRLHHKEPGVPNGNLRMPEKAPTVVNGVVIPRS